MSGPCAGEASTLPSMPWAGSAEDTYITPTEVFCFNHPESWTVAMVKLKAENMEQLIPLITYLPVGQDFIHTPQLTVVRIIFLRTHPQSYPMAFLGTLIITQETLPPNLQNSILKDSGTSVG